jgi:hypothetical protein
MNNISQVTVLNKFTSYNKLCFSWDKVPKLWNDKMKTVKNPQTTILNNLVNFE